MTRLTITVQKRKTAFLLELLKNFAFVEVEPASEEVLPPVESAKTKRKRFPKNPNNPSPSGDPYWDNPANVAEAVQRFRDIESGKSVPIPLESDKEIQAIFSMARR
jgi:hypothetical protein